MSARNKIPVIGIVGGIASGKSLVTEQLKLRGAAVVLADEAAHQVLELEEVKTEARKRWGDSIFTPDGRIDRPALGRIVFAPPPDGPRERQFLEQLSHPRIGEIIRGQLEQIAADRSVPAIVLDVPLLFESGWNKICDVIVYVDAPLSVRRSRAADRGWTAEEFDRREATQQSPQAKRKLAGVTIDNSGSREATATQVDEFWHSLAGSAAPN